jgi:hypothetical protein
MNIPNLAMVFTPVIFHDFNQVDEHYSSDWSPDDLFEDLILHYQVLFPIAEDNARRDIEPNLQKALNGQNPFKETSQSNLLYIINSVMPLPANNNMLLTQPMNPPTIPSNSSGASSPGGPLDYPYNVNYPPKLTTIIGTVPPSSAIMPQNQQRIALHQQQPQQANYTRSGSYPPAINTDPNTRIVPQRYQSEAIIYQQQQQQQDPKSAAVAGTFIKTPELFIINRSISENTITQRGSSITNNTPTTETAPYTTFSGPNSNENSSPLPSREGRAAAITLKRHSGTPQLIHAKSVAPPRHDSLRKPNARFQADGEKTLMTEEDVISPVPDQQPSSLLPPVPITTANEQSPVVPPIITTDTSSENDTVPPQKHAYYQPNIIQDFNLPTVTEKENLDCPTTTVTEPSLSESTEK